MAAVIVLIALFAIMFAMLGYFGFAQRGGVYDGLRIQLAQQQLNQIVPYVELYRNANGAYPDSLQQVSEVIPEGSTVFLTDSTDMNVGQQRFYYYERVGADRYILRGVGADGQPFTEDDIVPQGFERGVGLLLERPAVAPEAPAAEQPQLEAPAQDAPSSDSPR